MAVFVEGYTELLFVKRLIEEIAGRLRVVIETRRISGGATAPRRVAILQAAQAKGPEQFYVLIYDCSGDQQVKSRIIEEHAGLTAAGYSQIIGIRDVRPKFTSAEITKLEIGLRVGLNGYLAPVEFILCVMETEAWFLAESTHYQRIDAAITIQSITQTLGFDPQKDDMSLRPCPALDLNACYQLANKTYSKGAGTTIQALDYTEMYITLPQRIPYLQRLNTVVESFLST